MTFDLTIEEFKQGVAEFTKAAPTCDRDSLESGWKAVGLMYLGVRPVEKSDVPIAVSYLEYAGRRYMERDIELMLAAAPSPGAEGEVS